jgi:dTDP-glucose 4,6-dehydratase
MDRGKPGEIYCFGGAAEKTNLEVVETICEFLDELRPRVDGRKYREQISFVEDRLGHDWRYAIDDSRARDELGFSRRYAFGDGLRSTVGWYLEHSEWRDEVTAKRGSK